MQKYEYTIEKHSLEEFSELVFFCSEKGECSLNHVPHHQVENLTKILNDKGKDGFELAQLLLGKDGLMVVWKKQVD